MTDDIATIKIGEVEEKFLLKPKEFRTKSKGLHAQGKMKVGEKKYQVNILVVEIGTKPKSH